MPCMACTRSINVKESRKQKKAVVAVATARCAVRLRDADSECRIQFHHVSQGGYDELRLSSGGVIKIDSRDYYCTNRVMNTSRKFVERTGKVGFDDRVSTQQL
jgi:hypothetical protein